MTMAQHDRFLKFAWNYVPDLSPDPMEFDPILHFFLSSTVTGVQPVVAKVEIGKHSVRAARIASDMKMVWEQKHQQKYQQQQLKTLPTPLQQEVENHVFLPPSPPSFPNASRNWSNDVNGTIRVRASNPTSFMAGRVNTEITPLLYAPENLSWQRFTWSSAQCQRLAADTTLNVDAFVHTYSAKGELCQTEAGSCSLYLSQVYQSLLHAPQMNTTANSSNNGGGGALVVQKTLKIYNANELVKGSLIFYFQRDAFLGRVEHDVGNAHITSNLFSALENKVSLLPSLFSTHAISTHRQETHRQEQQQQKYAQFYERKNSSIKSSPPSSSSVVRVPLKKWSSIGVGAPTTVTSGASLSWLLEKNDYFAPLTPYDYLGESNKEEFARIFKMYTQANHAIFSPLLTRPTWEFARRIHSPLYRYRGIVTPGLCFVLLHEKTATNSESYYQNLLHITLRRHYREAASLAECLALFDAETRIENVATILAEMACIFSNTCTYLTDLAHTATSQQKIAQMLTDWQDSSSSSSSSLSIEKEWCTEQQVDAQEWKGRGFGGGNVENKTGLNSVPLQKENNFLFNFNGNSSGNGGQRAPTVVGKTRPATISPQLAAKINEPRFLQLIESFSVWLRYTYTGDCEDMAREIMCHLRDLRECSFVDPRLRRIQEVRRRYVPLQTLKGVTSAALTDDLDSATEMNAHMDITLMDRGYLETLMQNFNSCRPMFGRDALEPSELANFSSHLTQPEFDNNSPPQPNFSTSSSSFLSIDGDTSKSDNKNHKTDSGWLPTLICEGTGCLKPDGSADEYADAKLYVLSGYRDAFRDVKTMLYQPMSRTSSFYKTIQSALVHEFISDGYGIGELVFFSTEKKEVAIPIGSYFSSANIDDAKSSNDENKNANDNNVEKENGMEDVNMLLHLGDVRTSVLEHPPNVNKLLLWGEETAMPANAKEFIGANFPSPYAKQQQQVKTSPIQGPTYGIRHQHLINHRTEGIAVYTMPDVTRDELLRFHRVLAHNHPLEAIPNPVSTATATEGAQLPALERIREALRAAVEKSPSRSQMWREWKVDKTRRVAVVDFYPTYAHVEDSQRLERWFSLVQEKEYVLDFTYAREPIAGDNLGSYLLRFYCTRVRAVV
jgi:hypothetical protein